jgi:hypothetical protein
MPLTAAEQTFESMTDGYSCAGQMQPGNQRKAQTRISRICTNEMEADGTAVAVRVWEIHCGSQGVAMPEMRKFNCGF